MEAEALRAIVAENRQLEQNLTKRNEQYIFDLKKSLKAANLSERRVSIGSTRYFTRISSRSKNRQNSPSVIWHCFRTDGSNFK